MRKLCNEELNRLSTEEFRKAGKNPLIVIFDNVRSLNNIGSIFRTCDAFLVEKIYLCGITAVPPHKDIYKTALGATESVEWEYAADTLPLKTESRGIWYLRLNRLIKLLSAGFLSCRRMNRPGFRA